MNVDEKADYETRTKVESQAFVGKAPWSGIGFDVNNSMTPQQMAKAAKIDWTVSKRKLYMEVSGEKKQLIKDRFSLARDTDNQHLSIVSATWKEVQNKDSLDFFTKWVKAGHMKMEHVGSLWGGRYIWGMASINKDFALKGDDKISSYLLMISPHQHGKAMVFQYLAMRQFCWNTLTRLLGGNATAWRMPHSTAFNDVTKKDAEKSLKLAQDRTVEFKEAAVLLSNKRAPDKSVDDYFNEVLRFDPEDKENRKKKDGTVVVPQMLPKFQNALTHSPGHEAPAALGTWWGAFNAVSFVVDHESGRGERDVALKNAWLGAKATLKRRAFDLALDRAKKAKAA